MAAVGDGTRRRSAEIALKREILQQRLSREGAVAGVREERLAGESQRLRASIDDALRVAANVLSRDAPSRVVLECAKVRKYKSPVRESNQLSGSGLCVQATMWRQAECNYPEWKADRQARRSATLMNRDSHAQSRAATTQLIRQVRRFYCLCRHFFPCILRTPANPAVGRKRRRARFSYPVRAARSATAATCRTASPPSRVCWCCRPFCRCCVTAPFGRCAPCTSLCNNRNADRSPPIG